MRRDFSLREMCGQRRLDRLSRRLRTGQMRRRRRSVTWSYCKAAIEDAQRKKSFWEQSVPSRKKQNQSQKQCLIALLFLSSGDRCRADRHVEPIENLNPLRPISVKFFRLVNQDFLDKLVHNFGSEFLDFGSDFQKNVLANPNCFADFPQAFL